MNESPVQSDFLIVKKKSFSYFSPLKDYSCLVSGREKVGSSRFDLMKQTNFLNFIYPKGLLVFR